MASPNSSGIYLYAIIPTGKEIIFDVAGVGSDHDEVYTIPYSNPTAAPSSRTEPVMGGTDEQPLAALVSASPLLDYRGLKRNEAAHYLVAHQRIVEAVMQDYPLLPVKFGTVLTDETQVHRLLEQGKAIFRSALVQYADKVQMEVVVLWNVQQVFQEIAQEEPVVQLKAQIGTRPAEETLAERIAFGQLVKASLEQRRAALSEEISPALREIALSVAVNPLMDDSMVANVALLVDEAGRRALECRLEELDTAFVRGERKAPGNAPLTFRCVGPLPPYSFATVEVQALLYEVVDAARRHLDLGETATADDIKRAYRRLASQLHPDRNPNLPEVEARMTELTRAYQLLTAYAESQSHPCTYSREAVEQTLLIAIRRQEIMA
jgi:DnaJ-domain-containing protein 1